MYVPLIMCSIKTNVMSCIRHSYCILSKYNVFYQNIMSCYAGATDNVFYQYIIKCSIKTYDVMHTTLMMCSIKRQCNAMHVTFIMCFMKTYHACVTHVFYQNMCSFKTCMWHSQCALSKHNVFYQNKYVLCH